MRITNRLILLVLLCLLAACQADRPTPAQTVETYLQAKVKGDRETVQRLLCLEMEDRLEAEAGAFSSVSEAEIVDMACQPGASEGVVRCQGKILASYGNEKTEFQLAAYRVVEEDDAWKWCGETAP